MQVEIRKVVALREERWHDGGPRLGAPLVSGFVAAVLANPLAGRFVEDLAEWRDAASAVLGEMLAARLHELVGDGIEAYGKAVVVGVSGELETGSAIIHTLRFGDPLRRRVRGTSLLPAVEKVAPTGATFDIPLKHIRDDSTRSHHQTMSVVIPDAPLASEFVVALAGATGGRAHARIGDIGDER